MVVIENGYYIIRGEFPGRFPVRVLQHNITDYLSTHMERLLENLVAGGKLNPAFSMPVESGKVKMPSVDHATGEITIPETYLAALWATTYGLLNIHDHVASQLEAGESIREIDPNHPDLIFPFLLLSFSRMLFSEDGVWLPDLPNPERYHESTKDIVEKANHLFVIAAAFSIAHEVAHIELEHGRPEYREVRLRVKSVLDEGKQPNEADIGILRQNENDADRAAVSRILDAASTDGEQMVCLVGIMMVFMCLLLGKRDASDAFPITHPDLGTRMLNVLANNLDDNRYRDSLVGVALLTLTYFLKCAGVSFTGQEFEDGEEALKWCLERLDDLRAGRFA